MQRENQIKVCPPKQTETATAKKNATQTWIIQTLQNETAAAAASVDLPPKWFPTRR